MAQKIITEPIKTDETDEILKAEVEKHELTDFMKGFISRMIVFEKEAQMMIEYLRVNPTATEEEVEKHLLSLVENTRKQLGIPMYVRRDLIG